MADSLRPLLLLDVDGPLNPFRATKPEGYTKHRLPAAGQTFEVWLNHGHGAMLLDFAQRHGFELAWCTTWEHDANAHIGPHIGLPKLPVIEFGFTATEWKFNAVLEYATGRPVAWLDDDFRLFPAEREWFEQQRGDLPTLLHLVSPSVGITADDLTAVGAWATNLKGADAA
jgi:hypothetical protein